MNKSNERVENIFSEKMTAIFGELAQSSIAKNEDGHLRWSEDGGQADFLFWAMRWLGICTGNSGAELGVTGMAKDKGETLTPWLRNYASSNFPIILPVIAVSAVFLTVVERSFLEIR